MKKIMRGVCLMGVVALLATSCNKNKETATIQTYNEQFEVVESVYDDGEKVYFNPNDNKSYFESGDVLSLFKITASGSYQGLYTPAETQVDHTTWTPIAGYELPDEEGDLYAFCPGGGDYVTGDLDNENRAIFTLPAVQHYRENTCPVEGFYMASKLEEGQESFFFKNICGLLCLRLYSPNNRQVSEIEVSDKDGKHLSGDVSLKIDKVNPVTLKALYQNYNPDNASYMQSLNDYIEESGYSVSNVGGLKLVCDSPVQIGTTASTATCFYMTLRPLAFRKGFDLKVTCADGYVFNMSTTRNQIIGPNVVRKMSALSIK